MTWREHTWEFLLSAFSWIVAIGALAFVALFLACEAVKNRRKSRR
jgi:hypothetical protein